MSSRRIGVIGAGSWGTALADCLSRNGHAVRLWSHEIEVADAIREQHRNEAYLPGVELDPRLEASPDLAEVLDRAEVVVSVSPSEFVRATMERARSCLPTDPFLLVSASKGLELDTDLRMSEVLLQVLGGEVAEGCVVLSGPSFAAELARQRPTAVTLASRSEEMAIATQELFQNEHFRLYTQSDVIGTELGGALKNVIALAAGISDGLGLGHNARAALLTRSLAEIRRLTHKLGGEPETLAGLAGVGDLILTCTGDLSRNRTVGIEIGRGRKLEEVLSGMRSVAEGVRTTRAAVDLAVRHGVEMPISEAVYSILYEDVEPRMALARLMAREPKPERWS
ncbi:MAG: NAD(P)-dependent glycerol-3-phosphate dehydrogenase [marine benthic group bacterium]|nr:NAD(P)-dependent glycerol-3-phosphate dehydrogenase [Gemmatimonadota bacterium]MCL7973653.1 NAD(P)-dependent glycerol-3-phosphate dehydrogenase [Gemmatimonadota bacterium]